ncbi:MAG: GAF domain-containing protein [Armatimonadetes bacterium]|nr:GAF domain-containing protein [Armatimonadota bacterium]
MNSVIPTPLWKGLTPQELAVERGIRGIVLLLILLWAAFHGASLPRISILLLTSLVLIFNLLRGTLRTGGLLASRELMLLVDVVYFCALIYFFRDQRETFYLLLIPTAVGAVWYGVRGALLTATSGALLFLGTSFLPQGPPLPDPVLLLFRFLLLFLMASLLGFLGEAISRKTEELEVLAGLGHTLNSSLVLDDMLFSLAEWGNRLLRADITTVRLLNQADKALIVRASAGKIRLDSGTQPPLQLGEGIIGWVAKEGKSQIIPDLAQDPRFAYYDGKERITSLACVPLKEGEEILGVLTCGTILPRVFTERDIELLETLSQHASAAISKAQIHAERERKYEELSILYSSSTALMSAQNLDEILALVVSLMARTLNVEDCTLFLFDPQEEVFVGMISTSVFKEQVQALTIPFGKGALSEAVLGRGPLAIPDISLDSRVQISDLPQGAHYKALLILPLLKGTKIIGAISLSSREIRYFEESEIRLAASLAAVSAMAIVNARQ